MTHATPGAPFILEAEEPSQLSPRDGRSSRHSSLWWAVVQGPSPLSRLPPQLTRLLSNRVLGTPGEGLRRRQCTTRWLPPRHAPSSFPQLLLATPPPHPFALHLSPAPPSAAASTLPWHPSPQPECPSSPASSPSSTPSPITLPTPPLPSPVLSSHFQHLLRARSLRTITCPPKPAVLPPGTPLLKPPAPASPSPVRRGSPPAPSVPPPLQAPFPGFGSPHVYPSPPREVSGLSVCQSFGPSAPELQAASAIVSRAGGAGGPGAWVPAARAERPASQGLWPDPQEELLWVTMRETLEALSSLGFSVGQPEMAPQSEPREGSHNAQEQMSSSREERALGVCSGSASSTKF
ncbi:uncharacterized protein LOC129060747 [Pongo abelii]|uniref:uncharacterized protein LOC129060747 n=1 Tax=Pongo abelii TaxID=9601 RepID=UPI0023E85864|nr:uncharacterized protein LOC129060747 [Pongo abelii]